MAAAAAAATATKAPAQPAQKAARPPARPQPKNARHALEPNPFEQSFSSKPSDSASPPEDSASTAGKAKRQKEEEGGPASSDDAVKQKSGEQKPASSSTTTQDPAAAKAGARSTTTATGAAGAKKDATAGTSTPDKRALPPVASLTSPNQEGGNVYPWGPSSLGSLRAGPLSPAMLTGPQHHLSHLNHFDPSTFRTGFTPDLSNFKTGLTPLGSASGFPPPSPGTAAFLAMVNGNGPQMTPNTFTALTNHASSLMNSGEHTGITPMQSDVRSGQNGSQNQGDFDLAFGRQQQQQAGGAANARQKAQGGKAANGNGATSDTTSQAGKPGQSKLQSNGQTQGGGPQGAAGLFLLSQAHQELSKRDQQQAGQGGPVQQPNGMVQAPQPQPPSSFNGQQGSSAPAANGNASKGTKRKKSSANANASSSGNEGANGSGGKTASSAGPAAAGASAKNAKKAKRGAKSESVEDEINGSDGESGDESKFDGEGGSPGDDEEKRKNFLERNRQAALKCRQRKKAWLQDLQTKVAFYEAENGGLQETVGALRNEVMFLKSQLMQMSQHQHQQAGGMPLMPPGMLGPHAQQGGPGVHAQQYGPPQGARGPSQGASYSPASQAA